ncbi:hypothetical protein HDU98_007578 [Podochytrium sp. JEL0797]|nr:hypothetical protein HDU98_007578 [Podochytrium sp. JEL0797]
MSGATVPPHFGTHSTSTPVPDSTAKEELHRILKQTRSRSITPVTSRSPQVEISDAFPGEGGGATREVARSRVGRDGGRDEETPFIYVLRSSGAIKLIWPAQSVAAPTTTAASTSSYLLATGTSPGAGGVAQTSPKTVEKSVWTGFRGRQRGKEDSREMSAGGEKKVGGGETNGWSVFPGQGGDVEGAGEGGKKEKVGAGGWNEVKKGGDGKESQQKEVAGKKSEEEKEGGNPGGSGWMSLFHDQHAQGREETKKPSLIKQDETRQGKEEGANRWSIFRAQNFENDEPHGKQSEPILEQVPVAENVQSDVEVQVESDRVDVSKAKVRDHSRESVDSISREVLIQTDGDFVELLKRFVRVEELVVELAEKVVHQGDARSCESANSQERESLVEWDTLVSEREATENEIRASETGWASQIRSADMDEACAQIEQLRQAVTFGKSHTAEIILQVIKENGGCENVGSTDPRVQVQETEDQVESESEFIESPALAIISPFLEFLKDQANAVLVHQPHE